ncbi:MAG TPA: hypothetical protein VLW55_09505 [Burkholderiaceae bacterium]|nr:hypothetical protein [Burkholderiaceae bacterium]
MKRLRFGMRLASLAALVCICTVPAAVAAEMADAPALPRADFHAACPFTIAAPAVLAVLDAKRWQSMLAASRVTPPPYEAKETNFKRESVIIVALPYIATPVAQAALSARQGERYDATTGTLTLWYDVQFQPLKPGDTTVAGQPCLVTWVAARSDLQQIVARMSDGKYIAGTRVGDKSKKKP